MTAKLLSFAVPDTLSQRATLAEIREQLADIGEPPACIDFVLQTMGQIIEARGLCQKTKIQPIAEHEISASIRMIREVESRLTAISASLMSELVIAYTQIWHLEGGE